MAPTWLGSQQASCWPPRTLRPPKPMHLCTRTSCSALWPRLGSSGKPHAVLHQRAGSCSGHAARTLLKRQPQQAQGCQWRRCGAAVRCTASAAGAAPADSRSREGGRQSWWEAYRSWWRIIPAAQPAGGSAPPQSIRRIARKLWRVLNINRLLLVGALTFMVRSTTLVQAHALQCSQGLRTPGHSF